MIFVVNWCYKNTTEWKLIYYPLLNILNSSGLRKLGCDRKVFQFPRKGMSQKGKSETTSNVCSDSSPAEKEDVEAHWHMLLCPIKHK